MKHFFFAPFSASCLCVSLLLLLSAAAGADQYHSQVRVAPNQPAQTPADEQKQLQTTTDPYAKSMLLRDLAAAAAQNSVHRRDSLSMADSGAGETDRKEPRRQARPAGRRRVASTAAPQLQTDIRREPLP